MTTNKLASRRNQLGIRTALAATCGIACFLACSRLLLETGVHIVLVLIVMIPGSFGAFYGVAATQTGRRSALLGSLMGCAVSLLPSLAFLLLMATEGLTQNENEPTTKAALGLFSMLFCLCVSGIVGWMFAYSRGSSAT